MRRHQPDRRRETSTSPGCCSNLDASSCRPHVIDVEDDSSRVPDHLDAPHDERKAPRRDPHASSSFRAFRSALLELQSIDRFWKRSRLRHVDCVDSSDDGAPSSARPGPLERFLSAVLPDHASVFSTARSRDVFERPPFRIRRSEVNRRSTRAGLQFTMMVSNPSRAARVPMHAA